jgi:hypothetical protein
MLSGVRSASFVFVLLVGASATAQVIEFESGGLKYKTLSKGGVTLMCSPLPLLVRHYAVVQVAISNGSSGTFTVHPEDFIFSRTDGAKMHADSADTVVEDLLQRAGRGDVVKLVSTYESGLSGIVKFRSTNGYEQRRQSALAEVASAKIKAAAAASAIALVETRLTSGESTDGALFFPTDGKALGAGLMTVKIVGQVFELQLEAHPNP